MNSFPELVERELDHDELLRKLEWSLRDEPPEKPAGSGYRLATDKPRAYQTLMTDDEVLECRAAFEFGGATRAQLAEKYGVSITYMRALLSYATRSKLIPRQHTVNK